ncbi:hypothetical protein [Larkinella humicola]|uniref:Uncharacterized protein n=1 Tax=Larkinella humicola TaxID=2607654 RepID=A0A5N1JJ34_9BACT|nr:hypothetical protein [Larkinella humicola]KAA9356455.1 hypothetical protein F0P93_01500 [Larkinella humicola]
MTNRLFIRAYLFSACFLNCFLSGFTSLAQIDVIAVDTTTGVPAKALPFNRPFILKIPAKQKEYSSMYLIDHIGNKTLSETIQKRTTEIVSRIDDSGNTITDTLFKDYHLRPIPPAYFFMAKEGTKNSLFIRFKDTITLKPNKLYSLVIATDPDARTLTIFNALHESMKITGTATGDKLKKAKQISKAMDVYKSLADKVNEQLGIYFNIRFIDYISETDVASLPESDFDNDGIVTRNSVNIGGKTITIINKNVVQDILKFHNQKIEVLYDAIDAESTNLTTHISTNGANFIPSNTEKAKLALLNKAYISVDFREHSKLKEQFTQDNNRVLKTVNKLLSQSRTETDAIMQGLQPFLCSLCKPAKSTDYGNRLKNIEETFADIQRIYLLAQVLASQETALNDTFTYFESLLASVTTSRGYLKIMSEKISEVQDEIKKNALFSGADVTNGDTFIFSFETRTKLSIVPEVGLVTNRLFKSGRNSNFLLIPYLGASINFSQIDRDVPFKLIRKKTLWQRLSLVVGYSLVPLKDDYTQAPRDDFFEKSSLLTGLGFRFSNTVKLIGGYTWYYKRPASLELPRQLTNLPFIGVSFDMDIKKYIETIFSAVTPLRGTKTVESKAD